MTYFELEDSAVENPPTLEKLGGVTGEPPLKAGWWEKPTAKAAFLGK